MLGAQSEGPVLAALFAIVLIAIPFVLHGHRGALTAWLTGTHALVVARHRHVATRMRSCRLALACGWRTTDFTCSPVSSRVIPVTQSAVLDLFGWAALGTPLWQLTGMRPGLVFPIEVGVILIGAAGSLALAYLISERDYLERRVVATIPWALVTIAITVAALWITSQPMDMRAVAFPGMTTRAAPSSVTLTCGLLARRQRAPRRTMALRIQSFRTSCSAGIASRCGPIRIRLTMASAGGQFWVMIDPARAGDACRPTCRPS